MDDRFLEAGRIEPRSEFAAALRAKLREQESEHGARRIAPRPPVAAFAVAAVIAIVGGVIAFPSMRASAEAFLDLFRVRNFAAVEFDPARLDKLRALDQNDVMTVFDHPEGLRNAPAPQLYPSPEAAGAAAGLEVRQPSYLPGGFALDTVWVEAANDTRLAVNESKLRGLLDALDLEDVQIPPGLGGQGVTVHKPPIVVEQFKRGGLKLVLVQARSPEVALPPGVDLERLGEMGLRILGLDAAEARRIGESIDWHSTLVVPVPLNAGTFRRVTVQGNPGLLVTTREAFGSEPRRRRAGTVVMWTAGDRVFGLMSPLGGPELIQVAESVR